MNRRDFLRATAAGFATAVSPRAQADERKSNVLFIAVDDMNDWISCLKGYKGKVHTPTFDQLARRGVTFTNAHSPAAVCNPSRTAIMTGLRPSTTGVYNNGQWWRPALPDVITMPEHFRSNGYYVAGGGKLFHHTVGNNPPNLWDEYFSQVWDSEWHYDFPVAGQHIAKEGLHWPEGFPLNGIENVALGKKPPADYHEFDWGPFDKDDLDMGDGMMVRWAVEFLKRTHEEPFFLGAGTFRPHLAWYAPRKYFEMYPLDSIELPDIDENDLDDVPPIGQSIAEHRRADFELIKKEGKYREAVQAYLASISFADALVGRLLDALDKSEYADNTVVVLWSDHGWHLGEKQHWHKSTLWERATHVPFFVSAPGTTSPESVCERPVNLIDIYPTLIDLCRLDPKPELDGISLVPLLKNPQISWDRPSIITHGRGNHAVRSEQWRYIRYTDGTEELYDRKTDPNEWTNLANDKRFDSVKQDMARWISKQDAPDALKKKAYDFDPGTYTWTLKNRK